MAARFLRCIFITGLLAALLAASGHTSEPGYAGCLESGHLRHWQHFPVRVYLLPGRMNTPDRLKQMSAGFDQWVTATGGAVCYQLVPEQTGADVVVSISSQLALPKDARALGQTTLTFIGPVMTHATLELVERDDTPVQFQEICAHEFGHALGIDGHSDDPSDMMYPVLSHSLLQVGNPEIDCLYKSGSVTSRDIETLAAANPSLLFFTPKHK